MVETLTKPKQGYFWVHLLRILRQNIQYISMHQSIFPGILHVTLFSPDSLSSQHPKSFPYKCSTFQEQNQDARNIHVQSTLNKECDG